MCERQTSPRTHTPRLTASVNSSATVGPSSRSRSSGSPRQSVKKRWSPAFSDRTSSTSRSKYALPCTSGSTRLPSVQAGSEVCGLPRSSALSSQVLGSVHPMITSRADPGRNRRSSRGTSVACGPVALVVQKYGGSSVASAAHMKRVAERIVSAKKNGDDVVVVVSAMGDSTDELLDLASQITDDPPGRELDMLLTAGERISMALLAIAISTHGYEARSFTGSQAGVITTGSHGKARIIDVTPGRLRSALDEGSIVIVAGFQGVSQDTKDITTLGRGGSDTTAVAVAAALRADVCEIYTDVDGVFTADPRIVPNARRLDTITYEEMLELAASGAKVLMLRCVEYARREGIPVHVRSSYSQLPGTIVAGSMEDLPVEQAIITGVAHDRSEGKITVYGVPDRPGEAAQIFRVLADAEINIDMIVQNVSAEASKLADISFTLPK